MLRHSIRLVVKRSFVHEIDLHELTSSIAGNAMQSLASIYSVLGRHEDALVLRATTLERFQRVLPDSHPLIGLIFFANTLVKLSFHIVRASSLQRSDFSLRCCNAQPC